MLLVEASIPALNRLSQEGIALANYWDAKVMQFDDLPQRKMAFDHGGYVKLGYGDIKFFPDLFSDVPPVEIDLSIYYTATTEAAKEKLFDAKGWLDTMNRDGVSYNLYGEKFTDTIADNTAYNGTLVSLFTTWTGAGALNLTLDSSAARNPSPNVLHTTTGEQLTIDLASKIAAFYSHIFYIDSGTLYLVDMLADNGSSTYTEFDYFPSHYDWLVPVSILSSGGRARTSAYPYGRELSLTAYHDTGANIDDALDDILTTLNSARSRFQIPFLGSIPVPGEGLGWTDDSLPWTVVSSIRARTIQYDFDGEVVIIEGEGTVAGV